MRKVYRDINNDKVRYIIYSSLSSIKKSLTDLDFSVMKLKNISESGGYVWKATDCDLTPSLFIQRLNNKQLIQHREGDVLRKIRVRIRNDAMFFLKEDKYLTASYLSLVENNQSYKKLLAEEIGKLIEKNKWWDKLYNLEQLFKDVKNNLSAVSYAYSSSIAFYSWKVEDRVIMKKESWSQYKMFRELIE